MTCCKNYDFIRGKKAVIILIIISLILLFLDLIYSINIEANIQLHREISLKFLSGLLLYLFYKGNKASYYLILSLIGVLFFQLTLGLTYYISTVLNLHNNVTKIFIITLPLVINGLVYYFVNLKMKIHKQILVYLSKVSEKNV